MDLDTPIVGMLTIKYGLLLWQDHHGNYGIHSQ